jgi:hypothetical protein
LEVCGAVSFRLSVHELESWLFSFTALYPVHVVDVHGLKGKESEAWWNSFVQEVTANIAKKMTLGDALLLGRQRTMRLKQSSLGARRTFSVAPALLFSLQQLSRGDTND